MILSVVREGDLSRAIRSLNATRFGVYHSLYEWFNPLWMQDKQANLSTRNFVTEKVLPELYELVRFAYIGLNIRNTLLQFLTNNILL